MSLEGSQRNGSKSSGLTSSALTKRDELLAGLVIATAGTLKQTQEKIKDAVRTAVPDSLRRASIE